MRKLALAVLRRRQRLARARLLRSSAMRLRALRSSCRRGARCRVRALDMTCKVCVCLCATARRLDARMAEQEKLAVRVAAMRGKRDEPLIVPRRRTRTPCSRWLNWKRRSIRWGYKARRPRGREMTQLCPGGGGQMLLRMYNKKKQPKPPKVTVVNGTNSSDASSAPNATTNSSEGAPQSATQGADGAAGVWCRVSADHAEHVTPLVCSRARRG